MPQIRLEYTNNVMIDPDGGELVKKIHKSLSAALGISIENCKTRVLIHTGYFVGDGGQDKGFAHLEVGILDGRSPTLKRELGNMLLALLQTQLLPDNGHLDLQITVEIRDIAGEQYFKYPRSR